jgi:hypothetical protein
MMQMCRIISSVIFCSFFCTQILFAAGGAWTQKANFGGSARYGAYGFSIGLNGYIGAGFDGSDRDDFWSMTHQTIFGHRR